MPDQVPGRGPDRQASVDRRLNPEAIEFPSRLPPLGLDAFHSGSRRPLPEQAEQDFNRGPRPFGQNFDGSIGQVAHPADEAQVFSPPLGEAAIPNPLHPTEDENTGPNFIHLSIVS